MPAEYGAGRLSLGNLVSSRYDHEAAVQLVDYKPRGNDRDWCICRMGAENWSGRAVLVPFPGLFAKTVGELFTDGAVTDRAKLGSRFRVCVDALQREVRQAVAVHQGCIDALERLQVQEHSVSLVG
jgi:hypothetical protein